MEKEVKKIGMFLGCKLFGEFRYFEIIVEIIEKVMCLVFFMLVRFFFGYYIWFYK